MRFLTLNWVTKSLDNILCWRLCLPSPLTLFRTFGYTCSLIKRKNIHDPNSWDLFWPVKAPAQLYGYPLLLCEPSLVNSPVLCPGHFYVIYLGVVAIKEGGGELWWHKLGITFPFVRCNNQNNPQWVLKCHWPWKKFILRIFLSGQNCLTVSL